MVLRDLIYCFLFLLGKSDDEESFCKLVYGIGKGVVEDGKDYKRFKRFRIILII